MTNEIHIAAAVIMAPDGRSLLVRKRGSAIFMQAGGKIEAGETPDAALARELEEELGLKIDTSRALPLGRFEAPAANEPGHQVVAEIFRLTALPEAVHPAAEIEEIRWIEPGALPGIAREMQIASLSRDHLRAWAAQTV